MDLNPGWLMAGLLVSGIGFVLLHYGRKMARIPQVVAGLAMLIYPYFVHNVIVMLAVTAGLSGALWLVVRLGW